MRFLSFLAALFLACGFTGGGVDVDPQYQHKVALDPAGAPRLTIEWRSGGIELIGDGGDSVRVTAVGWKYGGLVESEEWLHLVKFQREPDRVALEFTQSGVACPYSITLQVRFPRGMAVEVANGSGELILSGGSSAVIELGSGGATVTGVTGDVSVETGSGGVVVEDVGSLKVHSASGGLEISRVAGAVEAETASGGIEIGLGAGHAGPVSAETGSGGIELEYGGPFTGDADLGTGSGSITVGLTAPPEGLAIEAETSSGGVSTNLPGASVFNRYGAGEIQLRGAGPKISLDTASGSIEVNVR